MAMVNTENKPVSTFPIVPHGFGSLRFHYGPSSTLKNNLNDKINPTSYLLGAIFGFQKYFLAKKNIILKLLYSGNLCKLLEIRKLNDCPGNENKITHI